MNTKKLPVNLPKRLCRHTERSKPNQRRRECILILDELDSAITKTWINWTIVGTMRISLKDVVTKTIGSRRWRYDHMGSIN